MSLFSFLSRRPRPRHKPQAYRFRPQLEALEDRLAPAVLTVNTLADNTTDTSVLTLRDAIALVDNGGNSASLGQSSMPSGWASQISGSFGSNDTIQFDPSLFGATQRTITLGGSELLLSRSTVITGPGASQLAVSGNHASRVFEIASGVTVSISGLAIENGSGGLGGGIFNGFGATLTVSASTLSSNSASFGGAIYNWYAATLTVSASTLSGNHAGTNGGGILNDGRMTVSGCILSGNSAGYAVGGAIFSGYSGTATIIGSTISGNSAPSAGGGILNYLGTMMVSASTISNNSADSGGGIWSAGSYLGYVTTTLTVSASTLFGNSAIQGGGIFNGTNMAVNASTVSGNSAIQGGGIYNYYGTVSVTSSTISGNLAGYAGGINNTSSALALNGSILAANTASFNPDMLNALGTVVGSYDLVGDGTGSGLTNGVNGNLVGTSSNPINPLLAPLGNYGGPTQTMLPLAGSPAIDAGSSTAAPGATDQRGFARIVGTAMDIGAVESGAVAADTDLAVTGQATSSAGQITYTLTVTNNGPNTQQNVTLADVLPANTTLVSWTVPSGWNSAAPATGSSGTVAAWIASLPSGASATFTLVVQVQVNSLPASGKVVVNNTASVGPVWGDPYPANNSVTFQTTVVLTPQEQIQLIENQVNGLVSGGILNSGQGNALDAKLNAAIASLNSGNNTDAINQLDAFINQVNAFLKSGILTSALAEVLISEVDVVIAAIG